MLLAQFYKERLDQTVGAHHESLWPNNASHIAGFHNDLLRTSLGHLVTMANSSSPSAPCFQVATDHVFDLSRVTSFPSCRSPPCSTCTSDLHDSSAILRLRDIVYLGRLLCRQACSLQLGTSLSSAGWFESKHDPSFLFPAAEHIPFTASRRIRSTGGRIRRICLGPAHSQLSRLSA